MSRWKLEGNGPNKSLLGIYLNALKKTGWSAEREGAWFLQLYKKGNRCWSGEKREYLQIERKDLFVPEFYIYVFSQ